MHSRSPVRQYCATVFAAGCLSVVLLAGDAHFGFIESSPLTFAIFSAGVLLGELLPIKIPRRANEEITLSASFAMALLLIGGFGPALIAQGLASIVQDATSGKPRWRVRFNVGQYALSMAAAYVLIRLVSGTSVLDVSHPVVSRQLLAMMLGAAAFFLVNAGLVGTAVALYQNVPVWRYFRTNLIFVVVTGGLMLLISPIVLAAAAYSIAIVPLCLAPVVAMYYSISQGARSEHAARHDSLTGLPNRAAFQDAVLSVLDDKSTPACILLMDLDRFKEINDTLGHRYGDLLLVKVAQHVRAAIGEDVEIARLGGDEFAIVGPTRGCEEAIELAQLILASVSAPFELEQMVVEAHASIGIALFPDHGCEFETLVQKADVAMYRAKETRSDWAIYDERHDHHSAAKRALTAELRTAVHGEEIVAWYQPELDLHSGQVLSVEALVRWEHPHAGILPPSAFVRLAEQTNMIKPLTHRVIKLALEQVAQWAAIGLDVAVAVNISAQVLVDRSFTEHVARALQRAGVAPQRLKLEVTETTLMSDHATARSVLHELSAAGVEIAIDDFGTGYSSLAYLADLPVSEVKIDRSFVSRMAAGSSAKIIVTSTIDLAHHLGLRAVAEGVEDTALLPVLEAAGCDAAQGYCISRPLASGDITRWLLSRKKVLPPVIAQQDFRASGVVLPSDHGIITPVRAIEQAA
ncbi:MAG TPA: EAL domain-containing protein [Solirubrobacteraceae bacterium]|nr:EAL domain-containing protein [Solirubrobacteraceae bacterium]